MNARILLASILLLVSFSGCFGNDPPPPTDSTSPGASTDGTTPTSGATTTPAGTTEPPAPPGSPSASLVVKNGATVLAPEDGVISIPANTPITFDASSSTDPEGAPITFAWSVDGVAEASTNATLTKSFAAATHAVVVTVSDGSLSDSAEAVVSIPGSPVFEVPEDAVISYQFTGPAAGTAKQAHTFNVPAGTAQVTVYLTWNDGATENSGSAANLQLLLTNASAGATPTTHNAEFDFEYVRINDTAKLPTGTWTAEVVPDEDVESEYTLRVLTWFGETNVVIFQETVQGGATAGCIVNCAASTPPITKKVMVPAGVEAVAARMTWLGPGDQGGASAQSNDFDFTVKYNGETQFSSGNGASYEFGFKDAEPGEALSDAAGEWEITINPFLVNSSRYTLTFEYL